MHFWFWVVVTLLTIPPIAYGLVMLSLYCYVRWCRPGFLIRLNNADEPPPRRKSM